MKLRISITLKIGFFIKLRFLIAEQHFPGVIFKPRFPLGLARKISGNVKIYFRVFIEFNNAGIWLIKHENLGYKSIIRIYFNNCVIDVERVTVGFYRAEIQFDMPRSDFRRIGFTHKYIFEKPAVFLPIIVFSAQRESDEILKVTSIVLSRPRKSVIS